MIYTALRDGGTTLTTEQAEEFFDRHLTLSDSIMVCCDGTEENPYYETIIFEAAGDVTNAESQNLVMLRYHQVVTRKSNDEVFHDEIGYWMWDARANTVMHSLLVPRAVALVAGGTWNGSLECFIDPSSLGCDGCALRA